MYAIVNSTTKMCENIIVWDGIEPYTPPAGTQTVKMPVIGETVEFNLP